MKEKTSFSTTKTVTSTTDYELVFSGECVYEDPAEVALAIFNEAAAGGPSVEFYAVIQIIPGGDFVPMDRFVAEAAPAPGAITPLRVEGSFHNPAGGEACEYSMVLTIRDERGDEIARRVVGVGAMQPDDRCTFTLSVEVASAGGRIAGKRSARH